MAISILFSNHNIISISEMDFQTLSRRQLQALCKRNRIPANLTNLAMADSLNALQSVEGIEEILNPSEFDIPQSPMVPPTGGRSRAVGALETPGATVTRRRAAAAAGSTSVRRQINESLDETEELKRDVCVKTPAPAPASRRRVVKETTSIVKPVYSTRRSARLAVKMQDPNQISEPIKINSFNEDEGDSVDQTQTSEITVDDTSKVCSEESEVKSHNESEALSEVTSGNSNGGDVPVAILEQKTETDMKADTDEMKVTEEVCGVETEENCNEDTKVYSSVAQETKAIIEDSETASNAASEVKASFEVTDVISDVNVEASLEKEAEMKSEAAYEDSEMKTIVDEDPKAAVEDSEMKINVDEVSEKPMASLEDIEMKSNVDEEIEIVESEGHMVVNVTVDMQERKEEPSENESSDNEESDMNNIAGHMVVNVTVDMQERKEEPSENESSDNEESDISDLSDADCQEEMFITEVEIEGGQEEKDELMNGKDNTVESTISAIGGDIETLKKTPKSVGRLIQISDDKENVNSGRKSVIVKEAKKNQLEDLSLRKLTKMFKKKLEITKQEDGKEDIIKATTTRPALKPLSENMMED